MRLFFILTLSLISFVPVVQSQQRGLLGAGSKIVDLSHSFDESTIYWPTSPSEFEHQELAHGVNEAGFFYSSYAFSAPEHGGTHLDAPIHFAEGGSTTDEVALARLVAPGIVLDISSDVEAKGADVLLEPKHIEAWESIRSPIQRGTIVLVRTGYTELWPNRKAYLGDDTPGDASKLHFPGVSEAAAKMLVERGIAAIGIDTASIDTGQSKDFMAHRVLAGNNIPIFENLKLDRDLPQQIPLVVALPMKITGGSGGPLRAIAITQ